MEQQQHRVPHGASATLRIEISVSVLREGVVVDDLILGLYILKKNENMKNELQRMV